MMNDLKKIPDDLLIEQTQLAIREEVQATQKVLTFLAEIERRKLYLERGYSSLYEYAIKVFGYSEDAAYRRVQAMRLVKIVPEAAAKLESGELTLTNAAILQKHFYEQSKTNDLTKEEKLSFIETAAKQSSKKLKEEIAKRSPQYLIRESIRPLNDFEYELRTIVDVPLKEKLDRLKALTSHKNPRMPYQNLIRDLTDLGVRKWDPLLKPTPTPEEIVAAEELASHSARSIPTALRNAVWQRDQSQCSFVDPKTKKRCEAIAHLQIDHIQPVGLGGLTQLDNLRLLCAAHNQHRSDVTYGSNASESNKKLNRKRDPKSTH